MCQGGRGCASSARHLSAERIGQPVGEEAVVVVQWLIAGALIGFLVVVAYGLVTGRLDRRAEGCCPADPQRDLRMRRDPDALDTSSG